MFSNVKVNRQWQTGLYAAVVVFLAYTMIFGFRKSFTVATFDGLFIAGYHYKTILVICQMLGYLAAKFYGIKYIAELKRTGRGKLILTLTGVAWLSWLCFALVPLPYNIVFLFINGFPLGILWGIVFSYVEGRKSTDLIGATLAVSFIFASGFVKSVGAWLLSTFNITEFWIPFFTGLVFALPLFIFVSLMEKIPPPTEEDENFKTARVPMNRTARQQFIKEFMVGLVACIFIYSFATIFRDIRDNFGAEIWKEMGFYDRPELFSKTETPISVVVLVLIGGMVFIKNNFVALKVAHLLILAGFVLAGTSTLLFSIQLLSPIWWMIFVGLGLYMVYIPFNAIFFDRLIATFKHASNVGFLIYVADSFGYVGSIGVLFAKEILQIKLAWVDFYSNSVMILSVIGSFLTLFSLYHFTKKYRLRIKHQS